MLGRVCLEESGDTVSGEEIERFYAHCYMKFRTVSEELAVLSCPFIVFIFFSILEIIRIYYVIVQA